MNYTAPELITVIVAIGGLLTIAGGVMVSIIMALKKQVADVAAKTDVIVGHVNSKATADAAEIKSLQSQLKFAREVMAEKKEIASLLAQSVVAHATSQAEVNSPKTPDPTTET